MRLRPAARQGEIHEDAPHRFNLRLKFERKPAVSARDFAGFDCLTLSEPVPWRRFCDPKGVGDWVLAEQQPLEH